MVVADTGHCLLNILWLLFEHKQTKQAAGHGITSGAKAAMLMVRQLDTRQEMNAEASSAIPIASRLAALVARRAIDICGTILALVGMALGMALLSYNTADPSLLRTSAQVPANLLGYVGSAVADPMIVYLGVAAGLFPMTIVGWGLRLLKSRNAAEVLASAALLVPSIALTATLLAAFVPPHAWPSQFGLGGFLGDQAIVRLLALADLAPGFANSPYQALCGIVLALVALQISAVACGATWRATARVLAIPFWIVFALLAEIGAMATQSIREEFRKFFDQINIKKPKIALLSIRLPKLRMSTPRLPSLKGMLKQRLSAGYEPDSLGLDRMEPVLTRPRREQAPVSGGESGAFPPAVSISLPQRAPRPQAAARKRSAASKSEPALLKQSDYVKPDLSFLERPRSNRSATVTRETLEETSAALQEVLGDYGIEGMIGGARPGPAVTLYEFDPPPGLKASKIENLSGDIARSMGVLSARISTVPGSKLIGIEIPNHRRQTVYLSEILETASYRRKETELPLALGKSILGESVVADLARMPHLLIAGTTGSGKSVAINAMILSLLYRHSPDDCRMILIDPKMLEFSVYDGIKHLLTPVVTDPKSAVQALKWVVGEMEDRYRKMSQIGVRNLDAFNSKVAKARKSGQPITTIVDAGVDPETGQPQQREVTLKLEHLPRIVVIVDEMADLMMVAGKEIESCVQRLAQMARASGIHVVLATQRPSVDVITGTIKANFPTRISFRLSSKIDSRTILNEQGAETLLGQGDMLYQSEGGKVQRVHAPYVSEEEIEKVVKHLKSLGPPDYVPDVTVVKDSETTSLGNAIGTGDDETDYYQQAVQIVVKSQRASTSYLQRRLEIGYNRAATLMERLEEGGVVSPPNSVGRREVLIGPDD